MIPDAMSLIVHHARFQNHTSEGDPDGRSARLPRRAALAESVGDRLRSRSPAARHPYARRRRAFAPHAAHRRLRSPRRARESPVTMAPRLRKLTLTLHVASSVGALGA